jgi:hypothetical protein
MLFLEPQGKSVIAAARKAGGVQQPTNQHDNNKVC